MSLEEFNNMAVDADLFDDYFGQRELSIQFNLAMMTNVTELETDRHTKMSMVEFFDAFGRISDRMKITVRF